MIGREPKPEIPETPQQKFKREFSDLTHEEIREGVASIIMAEVLEDKIKANQLFNLISMMQRFSTDEERIKDLAFVLLVDRERSELARLIEKRLSRDLSQK